MLLVLAIIAAAVLAWIVAGWLDDYEASLDNRPYEWVDDDPSPRDGGNPREERGY